MKHSLLIAFLMFFFTTVFANTIETKVRFGKGNIPNCSGSGICTIGTSSATLGSITARLDLNTAGTSLRIIISDEDAANLPDDIQANLANNIFIMENDYTLTDEVINALGARENITIPAGEYEVRHTGTVYIITF